MIGPAGVRPCPRHHTMREVPLTAYFDAFSGISGDMLVGALADAGADTAAITTALASLEINATVTFEKVKRGGVAATKFRVHAEETKKHRHLSHIEKLIAGAKMAEPARKNAIAIFRRLGEAEASVHGVAIEKVHFHEVGAADSIADIVGTAVALDLLEVETVVCSPINVGSGTVKTEHGMLPVPAPATARLLEGAPVYARGPEIELATPTGAAVAATLAQRFGPIPPMKVLRSGFGAGDRDFPDHANVLRVIIGEPADADEALAVCVIEANIDDLNPQVLAYASDRLMEFGALDVSLEPIVMKKGRPGNLLRVVCKPEHREALVQLVFAETSTLGVRIHSAERRVQARSFHEVETPYGKVRIKTSTEGSYAPEYEDCRALAEKTGIALKHIIAEANFAWLKLSR